MNQEKIGKFIAKLRKEKNMTQVELGKKLGVTKNAVSKWERGLCLMDMSLLKPLCEILDISIVELLNGEKIENTNDYKEKSENVITNTINYSSNKIKKSKYKIIFLSSFATIIFILALFITDKLLFLNNYKLNEPTNSNKILSGLKVKNNIKIYKKTIAEELYLYEQNIKIRNDFKEYKKENVNGYYKFTKYYFEENNKTTSSFYMIKLPQYIDMFSSNDLSFYLDENKDIDIEEKFEYADRKYFLLRNDINNDLDFIKYIRNNYFSKSNLFMSKRTILENYAFDLFVSIAIPEVENITTISGDYNGYIFNGKNVRELHIIRDNKNYVFVLQGEQFIDDKYIIDLFSTLEIR